MKVMPVILLIIGILLGVYLIQMSKHELGEASNFVQDLVKPRNSEVYKDLLNLGSDKKISSYFDNIKSTSIVYRDQKVEKLIPPNSFPFKKKSNGKYKLEIEAFGAEDKETLITVIQIDIIEVKTKNKIYELSRTYEYARKSNDSKTKKPD